MIRAPENISAENRGSLTNSQKFGRELFGLFLIFWALMLLLSLLSFDANDPSLNVSATHVAVRNKAGLFGAYVAGFLNDVFGVAALLWPVLFAALGAAHISQAYVMHWWRWCGFFLLTLCLLVAGSAWDFSLGDMKGGGMVGSALHGNAGRYLNPFGESLLWLFVFLSGLQLTLNVSWFGLAARLLSRPQTPSADGGASKTVSTPGRKVFSTTSFSDVKSFWEYCRNILGNIRPRPEKLPPVYGGGGLEEDEVLPAPESFDETKIPEAAPQDDAAPDQRDGARPSFPSTRTPRDGKTPLPLPKLDLLSAPVKSDSLTQKEDLEAKGKTLMACLDDFAVQGELVRVTPGPVVTMFEVRPAKGVRVSRIAGLSDDLARSLKAVAVRIQAPIPGSDTVGIEIPNTHREGVNFRELASTENFVKGCGPLTMILGKDIAGQPVMADLARMPHLLVAGATGAGKSVCLNTILISLLYKTQPQDMQLLLIDPKRIEMAVYADEPHLVHPVVTEMHEAQNALNWAVHEMERRYMAIKRLGVRHVTDYNRKLACYRNELPPDFADLEHLPYLVIVIDELADLMLTAGREVETCIVRLAQLARAAGIHLILATQRPSVDVVTGLIKANFPCRISFQVTSKHDSRTILDQVGAEHLLGRGDMLYKPGSGRLQRLHGPFLDDEEVQAVVEHWKRHLPPAYKVDFAEWSAEASPSPSLEGGGDAGDDALYSQVRSFVNEQGKASISLIQR
ncbi:MAG: DNA translocase FtsK 4TM domain-containing protein, partial [Desulfovibrio sp.]|nr:DNA translocase FtsK 4TM domain-containing protein [Desulfovibrio sp.]